MKIVLIIAYLVIKDIFGIDQIVKNVLIIARFVKGRRKIARNVSKDFDGMMERKMEKHLDVIVKKDFLLK